MAEEKVAVVLFNLGGPNSPEGVEPFLRRLFSDPAIIAPPAVLRLPLARLIARHRLPFARAIYDKIGGRSPILEETQAQAGALKHSLAQGGVACEVFIAMRCSAPDVEAAVRAVKAWAPERVVLLPLYPQYSTTTTASSVRAWREAARKARLDVPMAQICCYPWDRGFVAAEAALIRETWQRCKPGVSYRLLLSAHGLPERVVAKGDPYQWQVERCAAAIVEAAAMEGLAWQVCYQSRVGPMRWIGPATDAEIRRAGAQDKGVVVAPIAFVSEHSETLVELDIDYAKLAQESGVVDYLRVPTVRTHPSFIVGLSELVTRALASNGVISCEPGRVCPAQFHSCAQG